MPESSVRTQRRASSLVTQREKEAKEGRGWQTFNALWRRGQLEPRAWRDSGLWVDSDRESEPSAVNKLPVGTGGTSTSGETSSQLTELTCLIERARNSSLGRHSREASGRLGDAE